MRRPTENFDELRFGFVVVDPEKRGNKKLVGHYRYYGVSHNINKLSAFLHYVQRYLFKVLNRRSHKKSYTWDGYIDMLKVYPLAKPKIYVKLF